MDVDFIDAMRAVGVDPGDTPVVADGKLRRFRGPGDKSKNCWYVRFERGGAFGSWKLDISRTWSNGAGKLSRAERRQLDRKIAANEAARKKAQAAAAKVARQRWEKAKPVSGPNDHPYLARKHAQPHGTRIEGGTLLIPLLDVESGEIVTLQTISPDGGKFFLKGRPRRGLLLLTG